MSAFAPPENAIQTRYNYYRLEGRETFPCMTAEASYIIGNAKNSLVKTEVGVCLVSTVFLCINHNFGLGEPILFETMVFPNGSLIEEYCERYTTYDEAMEGHQRICKMVEDQQKVLEWVIDLEE